MGVCSTRFWVQAGCDLLRKVRLLQQCMQSPTRMHRSAFQNGPIQAAFSTISRDISHILPADMPPAVLRLVTQVEKH